jgi:hypothetical protein
VFGDAGAVIGAVGIQAIYEHEQGNGFGLRSSIRDPDEHLDLRAFFFSDTVSVGDIHFVQWWVKVSRGQNGARGEREV